MATRDNTKKTRATKVKRGEHGKWEKGTPSPNPEGAPKRGDSWAETIKLIGEMDGPSIAQLWDTQHKEFGKLPDGITMKQLVVMTVYAALLREPSPGNWRELMDRAEGPIKNIVKVEDDLTDDQRIERLVAILDAARARRSGSADESNQDNK